MKSPRGGVLEAAKFGAVVNWTEDWAAVEEERWGVKWRAQKKNALQKKKERKKTQKTKSGGNTDAADGKTTDKSEAQ